MQQYGSMQGERAVLNIVLFPTYPYLKNLKGFFLVFLIAFIGTFRFQSNSWEVKGIVL